MKRIHTTRYALGFAGFALLTTPHVSAQTSPDGNPNSCIAGSDGKCLEASDLIGAVDLGVPSTPLFTLLGASPENVLEVKTADEFAVSVLPNAVNAVGEDSFSLGLEFNPGLLALPDNVTISDLGGRYSTARKLSGMSVAFSAIETSGDMGFTQYGIGVSYIYDKKSPLFAYDDFTQCIGRSGFDPGKVQNRITEFRKKITPILTSGGIDIKKSPKITKQIWAATEPDGTLSVEKVSKILKDNGYSGSENGAAQEIVDQHKKLVFDGGRSAIISGQMAVQYCVDEVQHWNRPVYGIGVAAYLTDPQTGSNESGFGLWASASGPAPFAKERGQITGSVRYTENLVRSREVNGVETIETVDGWGIGLRYTQRFGAPTVNVDKSKPEFRGFIEAGYYDEEFSGINDAYWQAGLGGEVRVAENLFLQFALGDTFGSSIDRSQYLSAQLKWSFTRASVK